MPPNHDKNLNKADRYFIWCIINNPANQVSIHSIARIDIVKVVINFREKLRSCRSPDVSIHLVLNSTIIFVKLDIDCSALFKGIWLIRILSVPFSELRSES